MWGQEPARYDTAFCRGIIPTRVGTRDSPADRHCNFEDHPHACGDKICHLRFPPVVIGSSPRVWGQEVSSFPLPSQPRIIPTRVGTREVQCKTESKAWDHPHACGDKPRSADRVEIARGSSPRVWGQVVFVTTLVTVQRIIPTRVGTRPFLRAVSGCGEDHPHACGDKLLLLSLLLPYQGSSPRVWGQEGKEE